MSNTRTLYDLPITVSGSVITVSGSFQFANGSYINTGVVSSSITYYVSSSGNNSNNGLTSGSAFQTLQYAADVIASTKYRRDVVITVSVGNGNYAENVIFDGATVYVNLTGVSSNVSVDSIVSVGSRLVLSNLKLKSVSSNMFGFIQISTGIVFTGTSSQQIICETGQIRVNSSYSVSGSVADRHLRSSGPSIIFYQTGVVVSFTGSFAWNFQFAQTDSNGVIRMHNYGARATFAGGTHTGNRYSIDTGGTISTSGGGASYFPGSVNGVNDGTGNYN